MSIFHTRVYNELYMIKNSNGSPMINEKPPTKRQTSITWSTQDNTIVYFDPKRVKLFSSYSSDADDEAEVESEHEDELEFESDTTISDTDTVSDFIENEYIICTIS